MSNQIIKSTVETLRQIIVPASQFTAEIAKNSCRVPEGVASLQAALARTYAAAAARSHPSAKSSNHAAREEFFMRLGRFLRRYDPSASYCDPSDPRALIELGKESLEMAVTPILVLGPPGVGKTSIMRSVAQTLAADLGSRYLESPGEDVQIKPDDVVFCVVTYGGRNSASGLAGHYTISNDTTHITLPRWVRQAAKGVGIVMYDDFTNIYPDIQASINYVLSHGRFEDIDLSGVVRIANGNYGLLDGTSASALTNTTTSRFGVIVFSPTYHDIRNNLLAKYGSPAGSQYVAPPELTAFLSSFDSHPELCDYATCVPTQATMHEGGVQFPNARGLEAAYLDCRQYISKVVNGRMPFTSVRDLVYTAIARHIGTPMANAIVHGMSIELDNFFSAFRGVVSTCASGNALNEQNPDVVKLAKYIETNASSTISDKIVDWCVRFGEIAASRRFSELGERSVLKHGDGKGHPIEVDEKALSAAEGALKELLKKDGIKLINASEIDISDYRKDTEKSVHNSNKILAAKLYKATENKAVLLKRLIDKDVNLKSILTPDFVKKFGDGEDVVFDIFGLDSVRGSNEDMSLLEENAGKFLGAFDSKGLKADSQARLNDILSAFMSGYCDAFRGILAVKNLTELKKIPVTIGNTNVNVSFANRLDINKVYHDVLDKLQYRLAQLAASHDPNLEFIAESKTVGGIYSLRSPKIAAYGLAAGARKAIAESFGFTSAEAVTKAKPEVRARYWDLRNWVVTKLNETGLKVTDRIVISGLREDLNKLGDAIAAEGASTKRAPGAFLGNTM